jgi:hypothetical protein
MIIIIRRVEQLMRFYVRKAGLPDIGKFARWSPRQMRDTNLTYMVDAARDLGEKYTVALANEQAGHTRMEQTMKYLHTRILARKRVLEKALPNLSG